MYVNECMPNEFEDQCKMFFDHMLKIARDYDVVDSDDRLIMHKGTTLEQVLIAIDLSIA